MYVSLCTTERKYKYTVSPLAILFMCVCTHSRYHRVWLWKLKDIHWTVVDYKVRMCMYIKHLLLILPGTSTSSRSMCALTAGTSESDSERSDSKSLQWLLVTETLTFPRHYVCTDSRYLRVWLWTLTEIDYIRTLALTLTCAGNLNLSSPCACTDSRYLRVWLWKFKLWKFTVVDYTVHMYMH